MRRGGRARPDRGAGLRRRPPRRRGPRPRQRGPPERCAAVEALWRRLVPFEAGLRTGLPRARAAAPRRADPRWAADGAQLALRVARAAGRGARDVAHVSPLPGHCPACLPSTSSTSSWPSTRSRPAPATVEAIRSGLDVAGFPHGRRRGDGAAGVVAPGADPGRPVRLAVRVAGSPPGGRPCCGATGCGPTRRPGRRTAQRWPTAGRTRLRPPESSPERRNGPHRRDGGRRWRSYRGRGDTWCPAGRVDHPDRVTPECRHSMEWTTRPSLPSVTRSPPRLGTPGSW